MLIGFFTACSLAAVRRPSSQPHAIAFEGVSTHCDFADGVPLSSEYEALHLVKFEGPGFGALNGGVPMHACTLWHGAFPPLGNDSFAGSGFLGFSTLHAFHERTGKPISPETIRFDVRMTNLVASFAAVDGHAVTVELWSGAGLSFNDNGVLLKTFLLPTSAEMQSFNLVDENDIFVDCVRRMEV